jgi:hypothetical protein
MYSGGMTLPMLPVQVARRPYGDAIRVRAAAEIRRFETAETVHRIAVWLVVTAVAVYIALAYLIGSLTPWWP